MFDTLIVVPNCFRVCVFCFFFVLFFRFFVCFVILLLFFVFSLLCFSYLDFERKKSEDDNNIMKT